MVRYSLSDKLVTWNGKEARTACGEGKKTSTSYFDVLDFDNEEERHCEIGSCMPLSEDKAEYGQ